MKAKLSRKPFSQDFRLTSPPLLDPPADIELTENTGEEIQRASISGDVIEWTQKHSLTDEGYICSLYKYSKAGDRIKEMCFQYIDEIPTEHNIGLTFGAGRYECIFNGQDAAGKKYSLCRKFTLNSHYDLLREKENKNQLAGNVPPAIVRMQNSEVGQAMSVMKEIMGMILPFMQLNAAAQRQTTSSPLDAFKGFNEVLRQNALDNTQFYNDIMRKIGQVPEAVETQGESEMNNGFLGQIFPLIEKFLPMIIGNQKKSSQTIDSLKALPGVASVLQDKNQLAAILKKIKTEKGEATYLKCLKALKENGIVS